MTADSDCYKSKTMSGGLFLSTLSSLKPTFIYLAENKLFIAKHPLIL